jgi:hypothetical protein
MRELVVTNDPVLLSYVLALLSGAGIEAVILDQHMSLAEGSIGAFPRRLVVSDALFVSAANILNDAGLAQHLYEKG